MIEFPKLVIGTYQCSAYRDLENIVRQGFKQHLTAFDTAPSYKTEDVLGKALNKVCSELNFNRSHIFISDKIDAWQMRKYNGNIRPFVEEALKKLGVEFIDIMFVHWPVPEYFEQTWASMQKCKEDGLILNTGVCNVRVRHLEEWNRIGIKPSTIQIERHPLRTCREEMDYCREQGITVFSYSPLGRMLPQIVNSEVLKRIADKYGKNIGQVILRWHLDTGAIPVFTSKKSERIKKNSEVFDFQLEKTDIDMIESMNKNYKIFLESWGCPGF